MFLREVFFSLSTCGFLPVLLISCNWRTKLGSLVNGRLFMSEESGSTSKRGLISGTCFSSVRFCWVPLADLMVESDELDLSLFYDWPIVFISGSHLLSFSMKDSMDSL